VKKPSFFSLLVVVCALAGVVHFLQPGASGQDAGREVKIEAKRFEFVPDQITLKKGEAVTLVVTADDVAHSLFVRDLKINETVEAGETKKITLTPDAEGTYRGSCQKFCGAEHAKMKITIVVE
jgi:cytochrome c oxidase subunit II